MSRKLTMLRSELNRLRKATNADDTGTDDNFDDMAVAVAAGEISERSEEETYSCYTFDELRFAFGRNVNQWPLWARQKFSV
jgi:hypothetical protein